VKIRETLNGDGLEDSVRTSLWAECGRTTTLLSNITSIKVKDKFPHQIMFGRKRKLPKLFRIFGEMEVFTTKDYIQGKSKNRGLTCMFVGCSVDYANDDYRMLNLNLKRIIQTADVV
jgi:hypothetical protein